MTTTYYLTQFAHVYAQLIGLKWSELQSALYAHVKPIGSDASDMANLQCSIAASVKLFGMSLNI